MKDFCFTELCKKEVISARCGTKLGYPRDIRIDCKCGQIKELILPCKSTFSLFSGRDCLCVPWCDVERIGEDVIWVCGEYNYGKNNKRDKCCD